MQIISTLSILSVFSFLAPSPIPVPTDVVALFALVSGINPIFVFLVLFIAHLIGLVVFYYLGFGTGVMVANWEKNRKDKLYKFGLKIYRRYGEYSLVLCSIPFIGKPLVFAAGFFKLEAKKFIFWYLLGKVIWYSIAFVILSSLASR